MAPNGVITENTAPRRLGANCSSLQYAVPQIRHRMRYPM
jgi:hypothetical protein